ncbi:MAG: MFS transporter, partial [Dehalococcoidales bacterium]|nr:MFS transporter [Dehalococcoidales bacterium]
VGGSCAFIPLTSTLPRWFAERTGMALGITVAGFGTGGIITPPLTQWLISSFGWQQACLILGIITLVIIIPIAQFLRKSPQSMGIKPYGQKQIKENKQSLDLGGISLKEAVKTRSFWLLGSIIFCFFFSIQVIIVHIVPYAIDIGISPIVAASITSIIAGVSVIGRLSMGIIADKIGGRLLLVGCVTLITIALGWLLFVDEIWMFYIFALIFGIGYGGEVILQTIITVELFGYISLGSILAVILLCGTVGGAIGAPLAGSIFDTSGSYTLAFIICVIVCCLAVICSYILSRAKTWRED